MQTQQHLFLVGFMGCGKTHWGRLLAEKTGLPFLDLDRLLEEKEGKTIAEIFAEIGEAAFRALEHDTLRTLEHFPPTVIATGGGTPCFFDNMGWMNSTGTTVYLKTPPDVLAERLRNEKETRPLLAGLDDLGLQRFIEQKLAEREPYYLQAEVVLEQKEDAALNFWSILRQRLKSDAEWIGKNAGLTR
ncbi:MAG: shikimate kinase [Saprospiraceae bacterium]